MEGLIAEGRSLSILVLLPATALFGVMLVLVLSRTASRVTQFVIFALWLRFVLSAYHDVTYDASPLGLSWNALGSVVVIGLGLMVIKARKLLDVALIPFYFIMAVILTSGAINHALPGAVDMMVKYAYLLILILATVDAIEEAGDDRFSKLALWPFAILFGLQALSIALGASKATESDGSVSFIGGYNHEAAFSIALASGLVLVCLARRFGALAKSILIVICYGGIYLANYRTAILATFPMVAGVVIVGVTRRFVPAQRGLIAGLMVITAVLSGAGVFLANQERFADVGVALKAGPALIKPLADFSEDDRRVLSGRAYIWSDYLMSYAEAQPMQKALGFGPNSWDGVKRVYAHNTLVSYIYEIGAVGVVAVLFLWGWMIALSLMVSGGSRWPLVSGHLSFIILNMATMPMWQIEGLLFYGLLCGFTVARFQQTRRRATLPKVVDQRLVWASEAREIS